MLWRVRVRYVRDRVKLPTFAYKAYIAAVAATTIATLAGVRLGTLVAVCAHKRRGVEVGTYPQYHACNADQADAT